MKRDRELLVEEALVAQKAIFLAMNAASAPLWLQLDLTMAQFKGLCSLARELPVTISHFAELMGIGRPAASILIERLVEFGFVERSEDPIDRRRTFARLTPSGEELIARLRQGGQELVREWLSRLSEDDLGALVQGLGALAQVAGARREVGEAHAARVEGSNVG